MESISGNRTSRRSAEPQRVVVTGMGAVTPFGLSCAALAGGVRAGQSGIRPITVFDAAELPVAYAGEVPPFDPNDLLARPVSEIRDRGLKMAFASATEALRQSGLIDEEDRQRETPLGCILGSGLGPCEEAEYAYGCFFQQGWKAVRPTTVPKSMFNSFAGRLSIHFGLTGPSHVIALACASGASAIGQGFHLIRHGYQDAVLVGGVDSPLSPGMFVAWTNLRVLAKHEDPQRACRPFDRDRGGLVLSEAAAMLVLESEDHARRRGAVIFGEIVGFGTSSDASHITKPSLEGQMTAIRNCLEDGGLVPADIDYINAHGTGTKANDQTEAEAIQAVFGSRGEGLPISSTKSMLGHAMGASSAIEAIICLQTLSDGLIPPTINCDHPDPDDLGLDFVPGTARSQSVHMALSNSFGFGGGNCVLALRSLS